jgi:hypothetical protein
MIAPLPAPAFAAALALTAGLAMSTRRDGFWPRAEPRATIRSRLPWIVLATLAIASTVVAVTHPQEFAASMGQGVLDPGSLVVALQKP